MLDVKDVKNIKYFTKGHRGILYTGEYKGKKVVIKAKLPESKAEGRIENEGKWIKRLNKKGVGPKLIKATKDYFFYYFVDGEFFIDYAKALKKPKRFFGAQKNSNNFYRGLKKNKESKKIILKIIQNVLDQCYVMDGMNVDKEEMHHPLKHIIVDKKQKVTLLDFERCHIVDYGKNVTQFVVFLMRLREFLAEYDIKIDQDKLIALAKLYKREQTKEHFEKILDEINKK
ncbi:hypothetical protein CEE44_00745 [Candidatus Woesearchaeota archaeon B3_Woes]|nr:MAG: hypothetical protein CEE44_00745 [Candidatus Woesearchaeota archaeon B3_Woes]